MCKGKIRRAFKVEDLKILFASFYAGTADPSKKFDIHPEMVPFDLK
jgi:hypothetical protein